MIGFGIDICVEFFKMVCDFIDVGYFGVFGQYGVGQFCYFWQVVILCGIGIEYDLYIEYGYFCCLYIKYLCIFGSILGFDFDFVRFFGGFFNLFYGFQVQMVYCLIGGVFWYD